MPSPLEVDAELTRALSAALFQYRPASGGDAYVLFHLPGDGSNGVLICELTPFQLAAALAARRSAAAAKGKGKGRSRSPRRYLAGCKLSFFVFAFFTCDFERVTRVLIFFSKTMFFY